MMGMRLVRVPTTDAVDFSTHATAVRQALERADNDRILDLDEAWAALHFVLTSEYPIPRDEALRRGVAWDDDSLENVLMGGSDTAYRTSGGAVRYVAPESVERMGEKLSELSPDEFRNWYDADELLENDVPPGTWDQEGESLEWLVAYYQRLVDFYRNAAANREGLLIRG